MTKLDEIAEPFQMVDAQMRLELLLEYAEKLPPLPERYHELRDRGLNMVHECQSPVFIATELENGTARIYGDVPREAPTARAFTSILIEAFDNESPAVIRDAPDDALHRLGIADLLGMQRTRGLSAIYQRVKHEVGRKAEGKEQAAG